MNMKHVPNHIVLAAFLLLIAPSVRAAVRLPAILGSNMVLQRNTTVSLWGWANEGEPITIDASWLDGPVEVTAGLDGYWKAGVKTTGTKNPQTIAIAGADSVIRLENILFGEVWLCSGQSNMQQPLEGYQGQPTFGSQKAIAYASNPNLRIFSVDRVGSKTPETDLAAYTPWQEAGPDNVAGFSAVAYFFGQQLQEILDVPVGMIHTSWGGSSVQAWISREVISEYREVDLEEVDITHRTNHVPTALFNAMIHPLIPYTFRGALWYQGESNRMEPGEYLELFPAMVRDWRARWGFGEFPFYYAQIAPYWYNDPEAFSTVQNSAFIREAQLECATLIPNSGIAITLDIGDNYCIHPPKKKEVAERLLYNALGQTYGFEDIDGRSPVFDSMEIDEGAVILSFSHAENGLYAFDGLSDFEIAGEDRVFYPAEAEIVNRSRVRVESGEVPSPVAVRYGWSNWVEGTLYDTNLLPASSFRTDQWDDATRYSPE